jgi:hypothetical protein
VFEDKELADKATYAVEKAVHEERHENVELTKLSDEGPRRRV